MVIYGMGRYKLAKPYRLNPVVIQWVSVFASCAIEGDELAARMVEVWDAGLESVFVELVEEVFIKHIVNGGGSWR